MATGEGSRQIIVCCDGTNNTVTGGVDDTNVLRLHNHIAQHAVPEGAERVLYYDPGVGSSGVLPPIGLTEWIGRTWDRMMGLASGSGAFENVANAYIFLMRNWRGHHDRIYLFGFSRGAFTVRAVAGMVNLFGIVRPEYEALVPTLVHVYFAPSDSKDDRLQQRLLVLAHSMGSRPSGEPKGDGAASLAKSNSKRGAIAEEVRSHFTGDGGRDAWVHWIGVWDTVESVGLPAALSIVNRTPRGFLNKRFRNARHALAFDEHRWPFLPRLYEEPGDVDSDISGLPGADGVQVQTLRQRWYPGVHCDAGGSYDQCGISDTALEWMVNEVKDELRVGPLPAQSKTFLRHDPLYDNPFWALTGMTVRNMQPMPGFVAIPAAGIPAATGSVWDKSRVMWPLVLALIAALAFLTLSGLCLPERQAFHLLSLESWLSTMGAASSFALDQLKAVVGGGLLVEGKRPWEMQGHPGWAMFWDLGFIGAYGYLLGRIASRAFTRLAGQRSAASPYPLWLRKIGGAPMLLVLGDVAEDLLLWLALALHFAGTEWGAIVALWVGAVASVMKFVGLLGCTGLLAVRLWRPFSR